MIVQQPSDEMKKEQLFLSGSKPEDFVTIKKFVVPAFHQNGNIKSPTVASLVKHFLIANSTKYIQFLDKWIPIDFTLDCPPALLL
jgi:hypothetical protein